MIIRPPNLADRNEEGVPRDFAKVREYFNEMLVSRQFPWIPRTTPITNDEIMRLWVPGLNRNLCLLALEGKEVLGCASVLYLPKSSNFEGSDQREPGELSATINPNYHQLYTQVSFALIRDMTRLLSTKGKSAHALVDDYNPALAAFKDSEFRKVQTMRIKEYASRGGSPMVHKFVYP